MKMQREPRNAPVTSGLLQVGAFLLLLASALASLLKAETAPTCPCLVHGGEPGPGNCPCNVAQCYSHCVEELCPGFPERTLECSFRCSCDTPFSGCLTHIDPGPTPTAAPTCASDCDGNGQVTVDELVRGVNIALGIGSPDDCRNLDRNSDSRISVDEIITAVNAALHGCGEPLGPPYTPSPTPTPTPTATVSAEIPALVMERVADTLCWDRFEVIGSTVHCESAIGHYGYVSLTGFSDALQARAAFAPQTANETEEQFLGSVLRIDSRPNPCCPGLDGLIQNWRWLKGCWIVSGYAFDDTHFLLAPQPRASIEAIASAAAEFDLFARCLAPAGPT